jgi:hypothetical protein
LLVVVFFFEVFLVVRDEPAFLVAIEELLSAREGQGRGRRSAAGQSVAADGPPAGATDKFGAPANHAPCYAQPLALSGVESRGNQNRAAHRP